jgi:hypothetical protein
MARTDRPGRSARSGRRTKLTLTFRSRRLKEPNDVPISRIACPARIHQLGEPLSPQIAAAAVVGLPQAPAAVAPGHLLKGTGLHKLPDAK